MAMDLVCDGDCDDNDPTLNPLDLDGDGYTTCNGDCDDSNAALTGLDVDGDGASASCDLDCNDFDSSVETLDVDGDGFTTCDGDCDDFDPILNWFLTPTAMVTPPAKATATTRLLNSSICC